MNNIRTYSYILVALIFVIMGFVGLGRPLLWNDEGDTAVLTESVLEHGYPKIYLGKNNINPNTSSDNSVCVKEGIDLYICNSAAQYYVAAPFLYISKFFGDVYLRTWIVRFPFVLLGICALFIFGMMIKNLIRERRYLDYFLILFFLIEVSSVYYFLHIRQMRYYSLVVFLISLLIYLYFFVQKESSAVFSFLLFIFMIMLFFSFAPAYISFFAVLAMFELFKFILKGERKFEKEDIMKAAPWFVSIFLVLPAMAYLETLSASSKIYQYILEVTGRGGRFTLSMYLANWVNLIEFLLKNTVFFAMIVLKVILFWLYFKNGLDVFKKDFLRKKEVQLSVFSLFFIVIYSVIISKIPVMFSRYYLALQPIIALSMTLDTYLVTKFVGFDKEKVKALIIVLFFSLITPYIFRINYMYSFIGQLINPPRGPVGFIVEEINRRYDDTSDIVVATNYAERSLIYYLDSKVIIGGSANNLEEDLKLIPDVIVPRKAWGYKRELSTLMSKAEYEEVSLPVLDYAFNNIAEPSMHLFETKYAGNQNQMLVLYFKKE